MLLDPLEKQFYLPAALVEGADGQRWELKLVREKDKLLRRFGIPEADPAELLWIEPAGTEPVEHHRLVADQSRGSIGRCRVDAPRIHVLLGPGDEEGSCLGKRKEPFEIQVATVHDVERSRLWDQQVQHVDVVDSPVGDVDKAWNRAAQIEQSVKLDRRLRRTKRCPRKHRQTEIDGRRVERVDRLGQLQPKRI